MTIRAGPPWARRLVAGTSMFAPLLALGYVPAWAPDVVGYLLLAAVVGLPLLLFHLFGVKPMNSQ